MQHTLKTHTKYFNAVADRTKPFEVRKNDRNYAVGDVLVLQDYNPEADSFSGREIQCKVSYVLPGGGFGIDKEYCVLGLREIKAFNSFPERLGYKSVGGGTYIKGFGEKGVKMANI